MNRISPIDESAHPELAGLIARIRGGRGGRLLNFYRALLHSPALAATWLPFNDAVRRETALAERLRELVIIRVAIVNRAGYVVDIHKARYAEPAGVTPAECDALDRWQDCASFSAAERAALAYADAMTREVDVSDEVFSALRRHYDERQTVELTFLVGAYNLHTRFLKALRIPPEAA